MWVATHTNAILLQITALWKKVNIYPPTSFKPLWPNGQIVEQLEAKNTWTQRLTPDSPSPRTPTVYERAKLNSFNVKQDISAGVYKSLIESLLTFNIISCFTFTSVKDNSKRSRIIKQASKNK